MSLDANRRALDERGANVPLPDGILIEDIQISDVITGELLTPSCTKKQNVVLYLHGGGFSTGSSISHRPLCAQIARQSQWKVMCVNYRLAPEYKFPCALEDAITSYSWLLSQGYMSADIVFAGDSAGGGLAMAAVQMIMLHKNRQHLPLPAGAIGLSWSARVKATRRINISTSSPQLRGFAPWAGDIWVTHAVKTHWSRPFTQQT
jgi:monoterpene epsilon-lactone hydrolase